MGIWNAHTSFGNILGVIIPGIWSDPGNPWLELPHAQCNIVSLICTQESAYSHTLFDYFSFSVQGLVICGTCSHHDNNGHHYFCVSCCR